MGKKITPERRSQREKLKELLKGAGIEDVAGVRELFKEIAGAFSKVGRNKCRLCW